MVCWASFEVSNWKYYKDLDISGTGVKKIFIDDEIFSGSKKDLSDLRVIGNNNIEIPYKIISGRQNYSQNSYQASLLNNSYVFEKYSMVIVDLKEKGRIVNNLKINTDSENFQRNARVYGSDDMENWNLIKGDAYIYDYTDKKGNFKSQNTRLIFADSLFRYYKIEIDDENGFPVKINSVETSQNVSGSIQENKRNISFYSLENANNKSTELIADLSINGVPISKVLFGANDQNFNRRILIYSSDDKNKWDYLDQGYIFRYNTPKFKGENLTINFSETKNRYIKFEVLNNDNVSLVFSSITGFSIVQEIIFQVESSQKYKIFYGNEKSSRPEYDIDKYLQYLDTEGVEYAKISTQKDNSQYIKEQEPKKPLSERIPYLLPSILILISVFLIGLVYKFLKN